MNRCYTERKSLELTFIQKNLAEICLASENDHYSFKPTKKRSRLQIKITTPLKMYAQLGKRTYDKLYFKKLLKIVTFLIPFVDETNDFR